MRGSRYGREVDGSALQWLTGVSQSDNRIVFSNIMTPWLSNPSQAEDRVPDAR